MTIQMIYTQVPSYISTNWLIGDWPFNVNVNDDSLNRNNGTVISNLLTMRGGETVKISKSGINQKVEKCKCCNIVLRIPQKRNCFICRGQFSGWGFYMGEMGIWIVKPELDKMIVCCDPNSYIHNYKKYVPKRNVACSKQCAEGMTPRDQVRD